ncbi:hypothetical protein ACFPVT_03930 [Corynebacterium choanae]|uniref:Uncharacterized protein n=1 Tax=Corynebacterium choanae TaxID=1862358 RepID=A0A3G6J8L6_9CORY|nr:hypothetical protein [Corynebacterium choanae]AZA14336.1 hypothetical protein CCHOA_09765 [Corynebacterium choanae]
MKFDFYQDLDLKRSSDCVDLHSELTEQIKGATTPEDKDKLSTARDILGNPVRRARYDQELDDVTVTDLDVRRLHEIAAMPTTEQADDAKALAQFGSSGDAAVAAGSAGVSSQTFAGSTPQDSAPQAGDETGSSAESQSWQQQASQLGKQLNAATAPLQQTLHEAAGNLKSNPSWIAVDPKRQRSDSLMWAIVTGIIVLMWTIEFFKFLLLAGTASKSESLLETFGLVSAAEDFFYDAMFTLVGSIVLLVLCQLAWNIRMVIGRRGWLEREK